MSSESASSTAPDFCDVAARLGFLEPSDVDTIRREASDASSSPAQIAIRRGFLDTVQVDSVETLLHPSDTIPGYEILDIRGRGGMGVVYRARHVALGRVIALKTVLVSRTADANVLSRFEQEARLLAQLRHHNIVSIHDFGKADGRLYFAMEYVEGSDVDQMIKSQGPIEEAVVWGLVRQVAAGLAHAAKNGIVHRDIKPANLLLVEPPEGFPLPAGLPMIKIADFGLALLEEGSDSQTRLTTDNATVGSPHYMAPEQFEGSHVDFRADMYSLGMTAYHMLAGQPPFAGRSLAQIAGLKLSDDLRPLNQLRRGLSQESYQLVELLTSRKPDDRPADYLMILERIDALLPHAASPSATYPIDLGGGRAGESGSDAFETRSSNELHTATSVLSTQRTRRSKLWIGLTTAAVLLAAVFGIGYWFSRPDKPPEPVAMQEVGNSQFLFDGSTISGWIIRSGSWSVPAGDVVLEGSSGLLARTIFKNVDGEPVAPSYYRLVVFTQLHEAEAAEVHFALEPAAGRNGSRYILRLSRHGVLLGERSSDTGGLKPLAELVPIEIDPAVQQAVLIERFPTGWFIKVNNITVGALPHRAEELPEFRLASEDGAAYFSDVELVELVPAE